MKNDELLKKQIEVKNSLIRIQKFDVNKLIRSELGIGLHFQEAVEPAKHIISLFYQISEMIVEDLSAAYLQRLQNQADSVYNSFKQILDFSLESGNLVAVRNSLIAQIISTYDSSFDQLNPIISYSTSKSADFKSLEIEARASVQKIEDRTNGLISQLEANKKESDKILGDVRNVAAEHGVVQQAIYYKESTIEHETEAVKWMGRTVKLAIALGAYAILSLFIHKIPWLESNSVYDTAQLAISKFLIFGVLSYMLYFSTKNYLAHKHNAVVNKHRQNALMTYKALVDAAQDINNKDIILSHASACIYSPQSTGYSNIQMPETSSVKSVVELLTKAASGETISHAG